MSGGDVAIGRDLIQMRIATTLFEIMHNVDEPSNIRVAAKEHLSAMPDQLTKHVWPAI